MREFKFRVWDKYNEKWLKDNDKYLEKEKLLQYLIPISQEEGNILYSISWNNSEYDWFDNGQIEINQYTGLKDKYGNEIYEGDIVKDEIDEEIGYVEFSEGEYRIIYDNIAIILNRDEAFYIEVIGNIYENKEFLGDKI